MPGRQFALTLNRAETYFWSEPLKEKNKQTTPLKRPFGQCSVADECRKHRSAHIENTHAGHNSRCALRQKFFSAESKSKAWTEHLSWGSGHGKHTHTGELDNCRSRTKCTQRRQHVVQSGNIVSTLKSTALTQNNAGEREANREPWRFTCLCRSFPSACYSPFY